MYSPFTHHAHCFIGSKVATETVVGSQTNAPTHRGNNNLVGPGYRERLPRPCHSISTSSLMPVQDTHAYTGAAVYRSQSKPDLERHQVTNGVPGDVSSPALDTPLHQSEDHSLGIGMQFALMNMKGLEEQILMLRNHLMSTAHQTIATSLSQPNSLPLRLQSLLNSTSSGVEQSVRSLEVACTLVGVGRAGSAGELPQSSRSTPAREFDGALHHRTSVSSSRKFSRSGSGGGIPISRQSSSGLSTQGAAIATNLSSSGGGVDARKKLTFDQCE